MSKLFDDSSLAMIPSAVKDGKLYSIRPTDGSGDFTFSRGSNLAATRVDVNGLIEKGRENLLVQSNQFDTSWAVTNTGVVTGSQSGYDGSSDAWLLSTSQGSSGYVYQNTSASNVLSFSFYAKAGSLDWTYILVNGNSTYAATAFNLSSGTFATNFGGGFVARNSESVGNGWYRITLTTNNGSSRVRIYPAYGDGAIGNAGNIYIQDAQLEQGLVATDYIETGASTAQAGILEDLPRLDYSGGASCPSLLLEPSRTNDIQQSEYIKAIASVQNMTLLNNASVNPQGLQYATEAVPTANTASHIFFESGMGNAANTFTQSIYAKANGYNFCFIRFDLPTTHAWFDLENGVVGQTELGITSTIEDAGNGWYRCTATLTTAQYANAVIGVSNQDGVTNFAANGTSSVLFWGWQSELGSYPTSYIPTMGSAVTRSQDFATKTGLTSLIDSTQGTMFLDFKALANRLPSEYSYFSMSDGTYNNRIAILQSISGTNQVRAFAFVGGTKIFDMTDSITDITAQTKVALRYAENAFDLFINGVKTSSDTSGAIFSADTLDRVSFSEIGTTASPFKGKVNQTLVFPTALTDSECIALTTIA